MRIQIILASVALAATQALAQPVSLHPEVQIRRVMDMPGGRGNSTVRMDVDRRDNTVYSITQRGEISRLTLSPQEGASSAEPVFSAADHGLSGGIQGFAIGPDGSFYISANANGTGSSTTVATIVKGRRDPSGAVVWSTLARTVDYERCACIWNHQVNGLIVSPDNQFLYINSGSRTDHGELEDANGLFPGAREVPITSAVLRIPTNGENIIIPNDEAELRALGYKYADGFRNTFDFAYGPNGDLFATENGPDGDLPEEINWIREGLHFGFPWRFGNFVNPMSLPDYDPAQDRLINPNSTAAGGFYYNDPTFPPPPMAFTDPILNLGPNADFYRDPVDGQIKSASVEGVPFAGLTPHRSPLGLVFDNERRLADEFRGGGFVFSIGSQVAASLSFPDSDEDMLHLDMRKVGDRYEMRVTRIADGFSNGPIDAVLVDNRVYVVEYAGSRVLWEVTLPAGGDNATAVAEVEGALPTDTVLGQNYPNPFNPSTTIDFQVGAAGLVELAIFNASGQKVRTLISRQYNAGRYSADWDGRDDRRRALGSGTYLYRLDHNGMSIKKQLTLIK